MSAEGGASRRASTGGKPAPTRTGQALLGSLGALSNPSAAVGTGLDFSKKKDEDKKDADSTGSGEKKPGLAVNKFSAAKLVSIVQETSAPSIARLRKTTDKDPGSKEDGEHQASGEEISADSSSRRRTPTRTMSAQNPRTSSRRLRQSEHNLNASLGDSFEDGMDGSYGEERSIMDRSVASSASTSRRRVPQRSRSAVEGVSARGGMTGDVRPPRASRRRPERVDEEEEPVSPRRNRPNRARSAEEIPRSRRPRTGRRKPGREEDSESDGVDYSDGEESVEISDSDAEAEREDIDRSVSQGARRRAPARARSAQESGRGERYERRRARRRGTNGEDEDEGSPKRGPALQRSNTGGGPGPRSARSRVARNTAAELAVVASRERERQEREYSPESPVAERSAHGAKGSVSPIKSRQERRRMREEKEREVMERRMTMGSAVPEKPKKKEEPWMRRRLKQASGEDSFTFDDAFSADASGFTNNDSVGRGTASVPRFNTGDDFFQDPNFDAFSQQSATPTIPKLDKPRK